MDKSGVMHLPQSASQFLWVLRVVLVLLASCSAEEKSIPLELVSWTGNDQQPVALDEVLKIEFNQALAKPVRASSLQLVDEGNHPVENVTATVVGRWLYLTPALPKRVDLEDGSLKPGQSYGILLHGLPWLRALASADGQLLQKDLVLRFVTASAASPGALAGRGVESSGLRLDRPGGPEPLTFRGEERVILLFTRGIDPRSIAQPARWLAQGQQEAVEVTLRLVENQIDGAKLEVLLPEWRGSGALELPPGVEGLGGWPLPESDRILHLIRRAQ
ncbi:MAG: hypothetical protein O3A95_01040 [Planctomycetota bacterium]|nr:hypothetical protein [Planctomycetota bacterium]MDA1112870.1 hypothetical protein [Planctomycetota bacterium]